MASEPTTCEGPEPAVVECRFCRTGMDPGDLYDIGSDALCLTCAARRGFLLIWNGNENFGLRDQADRALRAWLGRERRRTNRLAGAGAR